jgi:signal transduction histidine kinase
MRGFSKLSNTLLDISKYDTPIPLKHEPISISELIKSIVEKNKSLAKIKEINIETNIISPATIEGDKIELSRVFFNILDNAIKYTSPGGIITVGDKIDSKRYVVTIGDNGSGIPKDILNKIFDPFFRGDASRHTDGAGLGLTLSKKIIENHKGTIVVKSEVNKGTNVIISLPVSS